MKETTKANRSKRTNAASVKLACMECGKRFSRRNPSCDVECPKCHGVDIDLDYS